MRSMARTAFSGLSKNSRISGRSRDRSTREAVRSRPEVPSPSMPLGRGGEPLQKQDEQEPHDERAQDVLDQGAPGKGPSKQLIGPGRHPAPRQRPECPAPGAGENLQHPVPCPAAHLPRKALILHCQPADRVRVPLARPDLARGLAAGAGPVAAGRGRRVQARSAHRGTNSSARDRPPWWPIRLCGSSKGRVWRITRFAVGNRQ